MATTQIRGNTQIMAGTIVDAQIGAAAAIANSKLADGTKYLYKDGTVTLTADLPAGGFSITGLRAPVGANDAVRYIDLQTVQSGLDIKASVRAASVGSNITLSGTQTIDGVSLSAGDRVLIKDQTTASANGIYVVAAGAWSRSTDADASSEVTSGMMVYVSEGTTNGTSQWVLQTPDPITLGTTSLTFVQFNGLGQITAGAGLTKTGNQIDVVGTTNRIVVNADSIDIGTDVVTLNGSQTLTNKSIAATQLTGTLQAAQFPALTGDVTTSAGSLSTTIAPAAVTLAKLANLAANSVIANITGSSATPTAVSLVSTATASSVALRDSNANLFANNFVSNGATTATAAGTTTLTVGSAKFQQFTGSTTQTVVLPSATTLSVGHTFMITNRSTGTVTINANGGGLVQTMAPGSQTEITLVNNGTAAGTWDSAYSITNAAGGTVTTVSVVSANGFAGSVSNASTTPAITISTTITGLLKGNGTAISAASAGTDFVANANFVFNETPSGSVNGSNTTFTLANTPTTGTVQVFLNGQLQEPGAGNDYTISGGTITYLTAPVTNDKIRVNYMK